MIDRLVESSSIRDGIVAETKDASHASSSSFSRDAQQYHQELVLRVSLFANSGAGVCRTSADDDDDDPTVPSNWVVMVPYAIPGETVRVRVVENRKRHSTAELVEVTSASASEHRVSPRCRWFGVCGGCQYQHMDVASQRYWKREHVRDAFERRGATTFLTDDVLRPTLGTDDHHYGYRSKITPRRERRSNGNVVVGFSDASPRRRLLDVSECTIASDALNAALTEARGESSSTTTTTGSLLLRHGDDGVVVSDPDAVLATTVRDVTFSFRAGNFFQINPHALDLLVEAVGDAATAPLGGDGGRSPTALVDCYCGSGLFSVSLADRFDACVGVEVEEAAVREARANAAANGARNCSFRAADAERLFATARLRDDVSPDRRRRPAPSGMLRPLFATAVGLRARPRGLPELRPRHAGPRRANDRRRREPRASPPLRADGGDADRSLSSDQARGVSGRVRETVRTTVNAARCMIPL